MRMREREREVYCTAVRAPAISLNRASPPPVSCRRFPDESWLLGSAAALTRDGLAFFQRCERTAGIVHTRFIAKQVYIVTDPEAIADVLVTHARCFTKPFGLRRMRVIFGNGLLTAEGDHWQQNRHRIQPAFDPERTSRFVESARRRAASLASSWRDGEVRDVYPDLVDVCIENLADTMFGVCDDELKRTTRAAARVCQDVAHSAFSMLRPSPLLYPSRLKRRLHTTMRELYARLTTMIEQRRSGPPRDDFLGLLLSGGNGHHPPMTRQGVLDECVTMLLAGHETAAAALVWALYLLALNPDHADALGRDLATQLDGAAPTAEQLTRLTSLRQTIDETLRLYPPTHRIGRTVVAPVAVGGHRLPVGADVLLPQWAVHRSSRWYDQPEAYMPGRWTHAFRRELPKFAYFPFSGGPRSCLGTHFVLLEAAITLGALAQHFRFSLLPGTTLQPFEGLTLLPAGGELHVKIARRTQG
jgi:cytochrome P450